MPFPVGKSSNVTGPPPQATAAGLNRVVFYDDMQSSGTFDLANTKDPTKKWFLDPAWPSVGNDGTAGGISAQESWAAFPPASADNFFFQAQSGARTGSCLIQTSGAGPDSVHGVNSL